MIHLFTHTPNSERTDLGFHALRSQDQQIAYWITLMPEIGVQLYEAVRNLCPITEKKNLHFWIFFQVL